VPGTFDGLQVSIALDGEQAQAVTMLQPWSVNAANLPEHADNAIHTDAGARAAGFSGALVAGVTTYAYMTHAPATAWGMEWLSAGGAEVRFRQPVMDADRVHLVIGEDEAVTASVGESANAEAQFRESAEVLPLRAGPPLNVIEFVLDASWSDYGFRAGDDCPLYADHGIAHPTSWPRIANQFCHEQLVDGSWIHVRSRIAHHGVAVVGSTIHATAIVAERFDSRAGERAVLDVRIDADGSPVASIEHEAIIRLHTSV
jgi:acyl dehydratase